MTLALSKRTIASVLGALALVTVAMVAALAVGNANAKESSISALPRNRTLYTTGTMWGPYSDLNPFKTWDYITGTQGLVYEHLFNYNPLQDKWIPWLASSGNVGQQDHVHGDRPLRCEVE